MLVPFESSDSMYTEPPPPAYIFFVPLDHGEFEFNFFNEYMKKKAKLHEEIIFYSESLMGFDEKTRTMNDWEEGHNRIYGNNFFIEDIENPLSPGLTFQINLEIMLACNFHETAALHLWKRHESVEQNKSREENQYLDGFYNGVKFLDVSLNYMKSARDIVYEYIDKQEKVFSNRLNLASETFLSRRSRDTPKPNKQERSQEKKRISAQIEKEIQKIAPVRELAKEVVFFFSSKHIKEMEKRYNEYVEEHKNFVTYSKRHKVENIYQKDKMTKAQNTLRRHVVVFSTKGAERSLNGFPPFMSSKP